MKNRDAAWGTKIKNAKEEIKKIIQDSEFEDRIANLTDSYYRDLTLIEGRKKNLES